MAKNLYYVRFDFEAFDRATVGLKAAEVGMYLRILIAYYRHQGPLPAHRPTLYRLVGPRTRTEERIIDSLLCQFCVKIDTKLGPVWQQKTADRILQKIKEISDKREKLNGHRTKMEHGKRVTNMAHKIEDRSSSKANAAFRAGTISEKSSVGAPDFDDDCPRF